jgi:hypothetical protein
MARRPDPERIRQSREAATRSRLLSPGELPSRVDELLAAWAAEATGKGLDPLTAEYCSAAIAWTESIRSRRLSGPAGSRAPRLVGSGLCGRPTTHSSAEATNVGGPLPR